MINIYYYSVLLLLIVVFEDLEWLIFPIYRATSYLTLKLSGSELNSINKALLAYLPFQTFFFLDDKLSKSNIRQRGLYTFKCIFLNAFSI